MRYLRPGTVINWKRSLGELSLIVVGVLIALAANSWWEGRKDRQREKAYVQQLLADLRENENRLEEAIASNIEIMELVQRFLDFAYGDGPTPPADSIRTPVGFSVYEPLIGTYTALIQNGDLQLLRNDDVRYEIMAYAAAMEATDEVLGYLSPLTWRNLERVNLAFTTNRQPSAEERRRSSANWRDGIDVDALLRDAELVSAMALQQDIDANRIRRLRGLQQPTRRLRCLLEAELAPVQTVEVEPASTKTLVGETAEMKAIVRYAGGLVLARCPVQWATSHEDVASIDDSGVVTGAGEGDARITASFRDASSSAAISVGPATK